MPGFWRIAAILITMGISFLPAATNPTGLIREMDYGNPELIRMRQEITKNIYALRNGEPLDIRFRTYRTKKDDEFFLLVAKSMLDAPTIASINNILRFDETTPGEKWILPNMRGVAKIGKREEIAKENKIPPNMLIPVPGHSGVWFIPRVNNALDMSFRRDEWTIPLQGRISSGFGYRRDPFSGKNSFHSGIDIPAPHGKAIKAARSGVIAYAGLAKGYGNTIIIEHKNGYRTLYAHLSTILPRKGQKVNAGETIGRVGSTGRSTGSHLHFEVRKDNMPVKPDFFF